MKILIHRLWRYHRHRFLSPGPYRVPRDISPALAERAIAEGFADRIPEPRPAKPAKPVEAEAVEEERTPRRRKGPAPENKARGKAPSTKRRADKDD